MPLSLPPTPGRLRDLRNAPSESRGGRIFRRVFPVAYLAVPAGILLYAALV